MKIVIDGNIGSGKTTQLDLLEKKGWTVRREPIDEWPLEEFYKDPKTWGYILQMAILETLQPIRAEVVVYERCIYSTRDVFWRHMAKHVYPNPFVSELYFKQAARYMWHPDLYIYLSKDPKVAHAHIRHRGQAGDSGVSLEYLEELDVYYKDMVACVPCMVHVLDANRSVAEIHADITRILDQNILNRPK
jgi:deoxyadenosine/deoxycytidine kinase